MQLSSRTRIAIVATFAVVAGAILWWLSVPHFRGSLVVTHAGKTTTLHPEDCSAGTARKPLVIGTKVFLNGAYELLVEDGDGPDQAFVVLRTPGPARASLVLSAAHCRTFAKTSKRYTPSWIYKDSILYDGSATLSCAAEDGTSVEGDLHFARCIKRATTMAGEP